MILLLLNTALSIICSWMMFYGCHQKHDQISSTSHGHVYSDSVYVSNYKISRTWIRSKYHNSDFLYSNLDCAVRWILTVENYKGRMRKSRIWEPTYWLFYLNSKPKLKPEILNRKISIVRKDSFLSADCKGIREKRWFLWCIYRGNLLRWNINNELL